MAKNAAPEKFDTKLRRTLAAKRAGVKLQASPGARGRAATQEERKELASLLDEQALLQQRYNLRATEIRIGCGAPPTHTALNLDTGEWLLPAQPG